MKVGFLMQAGAANLRTKPFSGPANHAKHVFNELSNLGHQIRLLAFLDGRIWKSDDLVDFEPVFIHGLDQGPYRLLERFIRRIQYELKLPYIALFESIRFACACRQELTGYDLLYERMGWMGYSGALASLWMEIPLVLEVNGDHLPEMEMLGVAPHGVQQQLSILLTKFATRKPVHVVATGEGWRNRYIERWNVKPELVSVVENGSEVVNLLEQHQLSSFSENCCSDKPITIIYIGAFEPWHGITILLRAFNDAIAQGLSLHLVLVGTGTELNKINQLIQELNLETYTTLTGQSTASEFTKYLAEAEIGVSPYCGRVEYSGLKLIDYKAAGLATIASGENGQPAVIKHGQTGWIVPPCDEDALCQAIIKLATDTELRREMGRRARIEAENCHSWQHTAKELECLFRQVLNL